MLGVTKQMEDLLRISCRQLTSEDAYMFATIIDGNELHIYIKL